MPRKSFMNANTYGYFSNSTLQSITFSGPFTKAYSVKQPDALLWGSNVEDRSVDATRKTVFSSKGLQTFATHLIESALKYDIKDALTSLFSEMRHFNKQAVSNESMTDRSIRTRSGFPNFLKVKSYHRTTCLVKDQKITQFSKLLRRRQNEGEYGFFISDAQYISLIDTDKVLDAKASGSDHNLIK